MSTVANTAASAPSNSTLTAISNPKTIDFFNNLSQQTRDVIVDYCMWQKATGIQNGRRVASIPHRNALAEVVYLRHRLNLISKASLKRCRELFTIDDNRLKEITDRLVQREKGIVFPKLHPTTQKEIQKTFSEKYWDAFTCAVFYQLENKQYYIEALQELIPDQKQLWNKINELVDMEKRARFMSSLPTTASSSTASMQPVQTNDHYETRFTELHKDTQAEITKFCTDNIKGFLQSSEKSRDRILELIGRVIWGDTENCRDFAAELFCTSQLGIDYSALRTLLKKCRLKEFNVIWNIVSPTAASAAVSSKTTKKPNNKEDK